MNVGLKQNLALKQQLAITPQLQQAIKLLQVNRLELIEQIQQELMENPTLEEIPGAVADGVAETERAAEAQVTAVANDVEQQQNGTTEGEVDWNKVIENQEAEFRPKGPSGLEDLPPIETNLVSHTSLSEHLMWQLQMQSCTDAEREAAVAIINNLDQRGWLMVSLDEVVALTEVDMEDAEGALEIVQRLEPYGCGARSLEECLLIQVRILYPEDPFFPVIVEKHLADIERRNYQTIARALAMDVEDVVEYHQMIRRLEPWPGRNYTEEEPQYISPDVYVFKVGDEWQVVQNEDGMPKLRVSNYYKQVLLGKDSTREERDYIKDRLQSADFLIKSIYKRQNTIDRVMRCILRRQQDFFERGPDHLHPMVLRDVADELGVHESTVSRVTSNKYVQCPQGIFELKFFFSNGLPNSSDSDLSAETVRRKIKRLIAAEDQANPLSDDQIVQLLKKDNVEIARRTVAKYREALGILPSSKRRVVH